MIMIMIMINIVRFLPHNLPKLYSTGRFSWSTIFYCAGGRGLKVLNGTRPVEYTQCLCVNPYTELNIDQCVNLSRVRA